MIIEKKTVIKALKTEPLKYGQFFANIAQKKSIKECSVCAVGAVIRKTIGLRNIHKYTRREIDLGDYCLNITEHMYSGYDPTSLLEDKNYLGALSCYFESFRFGTERKIVTIKDRQKLVEFVKKNFPSRFKVKDFEVVAQEQKIIGIEYEIK